MRKNSKDRVNYNSTINQQNIIDIYKLLQPKQQNTHFFFFASPHKTLIKIDHILGHKTSLKA